MGVTITKGTKVGPKDDPKSVNFHREASAPPEAFDARLAELVAAGMRPGALVGETPYAGGPRLVSRVYQHLTLVRHKGRIHVIHGAIRDRWTALGGFGWGLPTTDEEDAGVGGGRRNLFDLQEAGPGGGWEAAILWTRMTGAHHVAGLAFDRFREAGGVGALGYPTEGTVPTANRDGFVCRFRRVFVDDADSAILIPRNRREAWVVQGDIHRLWNSMGGAASPLGYPRGDEFGPDGERRQYFEDGTVVWRPATGSFVEMPEWHIRFRGLFVARSKGDAFTPNIEFYFHVGAVPRIGSAAGTRTTKLPVHGAEYDKLRPGRWRHDDVVVYHGNADTVLLTLSGAERNTGDPDAYLPAIQEITKKAVNGALGAIAGLIAGPAGAAGAAAASPITDLLGKEIGKEINDLLGTGDEPLYSVAVPLNLATIRGHFAAGAQMAAARNADGSAAAPIPYHFIVDLTGNKRWVQLFFEMRRGAP